MPTRSQSGFTLVEMAIVFLIVALLLGSGLVVVATQADQQKITDTRKVLDEAKEALAAYAVSSNGGANTPRLPCPDITQDGIEDRVGGVPNADADCLVIVAGRAEGNLPWVTLGVTGLDAWGHRLRYSVTSSFTRSGATPNGVRLSDAVVGNLRVQDNSTLPPTDLALAVPVVIMSHGKNGWGSTNSNGNPAPPVPVANTNELENTTNNGTFFANPLTEEITAPGGQFDDIVTWLPKSMLITRLLQANRAPPQ